MCVYWRIMKFLSISEVHQVSSHDLRVFDHTPHPQSLDSWRSESLSLHAGLDTQAEEDKDAGASKSNSRGESVKCKQGRPFQYNVEE